MTPTDRYLAVFLGSHDGPRRAAWEALPEAERRAKEQEGMAAWGDWMGRHADAVVEAGGPLGKTKRVSPDGAADVANAMAAFIIVRAASHEAAAKMFGDHPHFAVFPGEAVEVMPVLAVPGA